MSKTIYLTVFITSLVFTSCNASGQGENNKTTAGENGVVHLTEDAFKKLVFDYNNNEEWKYLGNKPAIIDFYADWCAPCRIISPRLEEVAKEYKDKLIVYKVDTEKEKILARDLGISGLPTLLFIPVKGEPQMSVGVIPKETIVRAVNEILLID